MYGWSTTHHVVDSGLLFVAFLAISAAGGGVGPVDAVGPAVVHFGRRVTPIGTSGGCSLKVDGLSGCQLAWIELQHVDIVSIGVSGRRSGGLFRGFWGAGSAFLNDSGVTSS